MTAIDRTTGVTADSLAALTGRAACPTETDSAAKQDSILVNPIPATGVASQQYPERTVETLFWHDIAIYNWYTRIKIQQRLSSPWQIAFTENLVSTLQRQPDRWKDEHAARVILSRTPWNAPSLIRGWQWQIAMDSKIFRDDFSRQTRETRNNDFSLSGFYSRLERHLYPNLHVGGQVGYRLEQLLDRNEHGPNLALGVALAPTLWQNYYHRFEAEAEINKLPDRRNDDVRLSYSVSRQFEHETSDSLFLHFAHLRRENYYAVGETLYVDQLNRDRRAFENRLDYRMNSAWHLALRTELGESRVNGSRRIIELARIPFPTRQEVAGQSRSEFSHTDFDAYHQANLAWQRPNVNNEWTIQFISRSINYSEQAVASPLLRRYAGAGYDSKEWHLVLSHRLRWRVGKSDSLRWYGSITRYTHETGNRKHPDDFDRLTYQANLLYGHRFFTAFLLQWEAHAYLEHHVYLKSSHSAGNNWRRVFKLQPHLIFNLAPGVYLKQSFGVLSQYIVYDFPEPLSPGQSNVFRNFFVADSLSLRLSRRTQCVAQYRLRLEERGLLDWANWRQRPWFDRNEHWLSLVFDHRPATFWQLAPGVTYLRQRDWSYRLGLSEGLKRYRSGEQTIVSPTLSISYVHAPRAVIIFSARRQILFRRQARSSLDNFRLTVQWSI